MGCKCTCGNCCTHGEEAKARQQTDQVWPTAQELLLEFYKEEEKK